MSRRLVNRSGRTAGEPDRADYRPPTDDAVYQPLSFPLNEQARHKLGELSRSRQTNNYTVQMSEALRHLGLSVYDTQQRLYERRERLEQLRKRRQDRGLGPSDDEERLMAHIQKLEQDIRPLTNQSEAAVRHVIDLQAELDGENTIIGQLYTKAATDVQRHMDAQDQNGEEPDPVTSIISEMNSNRQTRSANYQSTTPQQRYAGDNDYVAFKKLWHDGLAGDEGPPLPDASKWFRSNGTPVMGISLDEIGGGGDDDDDSDQDLAVAREVISLNCPLTLRPLVQPFSNKKCKHTFEKDAILEYLQNGQTKQCPQTGCPQSFRRADFQRDFFLDPVVLRRIQRAKNAANNMEMDDDSDSDAGNESVIATGRRAKPGRNLKKEERG